MGTINDIKESYQMLWQQGNFGLIVLYTLAVLSILAIGATAIVLLIPAVVLTASIAVPVVLVALYFMFS